MLYKENLGTGTPIPITPEMQRVKHNQETLSSVLERSGGKDAHLTPDLNSPLKPSSLPLLLTDLIFFLSFMLGPLLLHLMLLKTLIYFSLVDDKTEF